MLKNRKLILLVDQDPNYRANLRLALEAAGFAVGEAVNGKEGERTLKRVQPHAVITDVMVEAVDLGSTLEKLKEIGSHVPVYVVSNAAKALEDSIDLESLNIAGLFQKPIDTGAVVQTLKAALKLA